MKRILAFTLSIILLFSIVACSGKVYCAHCGGKISKNASFCESCGLEVRGNDDKNNSPSNDAYSTADQEDLRTTATAHTKEPTSTLGSVEASATTTATTTATAKPTTKPTIKPTVKPTIKTTTKPTTRPTVQPTIKPTATPTVQPTIKPTATPTVQPTIKPTATPYNPYANVQKYDIIKFGKYEQDDDNSNGLEDIEWIVLEVNEDKIFVLSKYAIECRKYNKFLNNPTWERSDIREWLNGSFFEWAFSKEEQSMIPTVTVSAEKLSNYNQSAENDTKDKVFLLSSAERKELLSSVVMPGCVLTQYAKNNSSYWNHTGNSCKWWLRTSLYMDNRALCFGLGFNDEAVNAEDVAVRPAMWININR